ncbi:MAG: FAD-dependent oxidoreductase, partial [Alphaproteobacteria bacterium]|nr:FAD-dependent oxidoreductase [Alphaproteobacteria bacterium]
PAAGERFETSAPVLIVGAGAAGLTAGLAARASGAEVVVLERDASPGGSTALSSGFVPAAGTSFQAKAGIADSAERFARDIQAKAKGGADPGLVTALSSAIGPTIDWLARDQGVPFDVMTDFLYPGHGVHRMHAVPERTGAALMEYLAAAAKRAGVDIVPSAHVHGLYADASSRVAGAAFDRPDGTVERIGCDALVLACSGFAGNPALVARHIPEMADALFFGHVGNTGDALAWGEGLGATLRDMTAYQGHGSVATPHSILVTWALMMEGGIQVNTRGERFSDEHQGYSEQSVAVLAQPGGVAWNIYDDRRHALGLSFPDYRAAVAAGGVRAAADAGALAARCDLPVATLARTLNQTYDYAAGRAADPFGRDFTAKPALTPPFRAVKVTGALFHTQGGLAIDGAARVLRPDGTALPNLFAAGGAACGVSGAHVWGYLSGNGLLAAIGLGRLAGADAAALV